MNGESRSLSSAGCGLRTAIGACMVVGLAVTVCVGASIDERTDGQALFKTYCASCHGVDATGHGPVARFLRRPPPDLTELSKRNAGMFPAARVRRIIEGRDVEPHGDRDMPVWGDAFSAQDGRPAGARIDAIVQYLSTIQHRQAQRETPSAGAS